MLHMQVVNLVVLHHISVVGMGRAAAPGGIDYDCGAYIYIYVFCHGVVLAIQEGFVMKGA